jgi:Cyclin, N-terminal domain
MTQMAPLVVVAATELASSTIPALTFSPIFSTREKTNKPNIIIEHTIDQYSFTMRQPTNTKMDISSPSSQTNAVTDSCSSSRSSPMTCSNFPQHHHYHHDPEDPHHVNTRATLQQMRHLERTTYKRPLARQLPEPFNGLWRQQIVDWMYTLVKYCKLRHESAAAASYYLDVAVCKGLVQSPNDYQLGAMTALYLALKVYDSPCVRVVKLSSLVKLGNGEFTEDDILHMERDLVKLLGWRVNPPTPNCFLQQYLTLLPRQFHGEEESSNMNVVRDRIEEVALLAIEQVTSRDYFLSVPSSVLGYSAMLFAVETIDLQYQQQREQHEQQHRHHHHLASSPHLTFLEYQTFLLNMTQVADLDSTNSPILTRASVLLDRTMKSLPIPASYISEGEEFFEEHASSDQTTLRKNRLQDSSTSTLGDVQFVDAAVGYEDGYSPNHVVMH